MPKHTAYLATGLICTADGQELTATLIPDPTPLGTTGWIRVRDADFGPYRALLSPTGHLIQAPAGFAFADEGPIPGIPDPAKLGAVKIDIIPLGGSPRYLSLSGKKLYK